MKHLFLSLTVFAAVTAFAQKGAVQSGSPAQLEASNGKKASVYLQSMEGGKLTFQPRKSTKNMTVPADKIKSLSFSMNKEEFETCRELNIISSEEISEISAKTEIAKAEKLNVIFNVILDNISGMFYKSDYESFIAAIKPFINGREPYMAIENNLDDYFIMLMESYFQQKDFPQVKNCAAVLKESTDETKAEAANATLALVAILQHDFATAESIRSEIKSEAGSLYIKAEMERAQGESKKAMLTVTTIIASHANDRDWMPKSELLAAYLYLDMTGTNSIISTNSVINTARQVKNIYAGNHSAGDAAKLWISLGGDVIEAKENAEKAARAAAAKKAKEEMAAKREKDRLVRKAEREAAKAAKEAEALVASTNLNTTTETQSE